MTRTVQILLLLACLVASTDAHELRPAYLEMRQTGSETFDVMWKVPARGDLRLGLHVRFPEFCKEVQERVAYTANNAHIERWKVQCPGGIAGQTITIDGLSSMLTDVLIRLQWSDGATETVRLNAEQTEYIVKGSPGWHQVAGAYTWMGIEHILLGVDHLLFVLGLLLIVRGVRTLVETITAFTVAHSISLALAVFGIVNVPARPVDAAIALSIVFLGAEILHARRGQQGLTVRFPWIVAFAFGLLHGLGFAGALTSLGLPPTDIPLALLFFNVGVEIGQLLFVLFFVVMAWAFRTLQVVWPKWSEPVPAYVIGTLASYWFIGRFLVLIGI